MENSNWVIRILTPCFIFGLLFVPCLSQAQPDKFDKELVPNKVLAPPPAPLTAFQIAALTNPWPLVPGVYEFRASHSALCIYCASDAGIRAASHSNSYRAA